MREKRAQGAVCQARNKNGIGGGASFAAEEGAGDFSAGVHAFFKINGKREEVNPFADAAHGGCGKDDGFFHAESDRAACLSGECASLKGEGARANDG